MNKRLDKPGVLAGAQPSRRKGAISRAFARWKGKAALLFVASALAVTAASCRFDARGLPLKADAALVDGSNPDAKGEDGVARDGGKDSLPAQNDARMDSLQADSNAAKWNPAWKHCRDITVAKKGPAAIPPDYPHAVDVQISDPALASVRFLKGSCAAPDNSSFLPMWIENTDGAGKGRIWTVAGIPDAPGFAMIYGNPAAASMSNGEAVFPLFDAFIGPSLNPSKWACQGSCGISGGVLTIANATAYPAIHSVAQFGTGYALAAMAAFSGSSGSAQHDAYLGFSSQFINASQSHGLPLNSGINFSTISGMKIRVRNDAVKLVSVTIPPAFASAGAAKLLDSGKNVLASAAFSNGVATFGNPQGLSPNTDYYVAVSGAGSIAHPIQTPVSYPYHGTYVDWTTGMENMATDNSGYAFSILSISVQPAAGAAAYPDVPFAAWAYKGPSKKYALQFNTQEASSAKTATDNSYHVWGIDRGQSGAEYYYDWVLADPVQGQYPAGSYPLIAHPNNAAITVKLKWIFVRPKLVQEPAISVGPEQTQ